MDSSAVSPGRALRVLLLSAAAMAAVAILTPLAGPADISLTKAFQGVWPDAQVYFEVRWPRTILGLLAGGGLAIAGVLFQAVLRDPLATPYTLGISSGASLGAVVAIVTGLQQFGGLPGLWGAAFLGSAATLALVLGVAADGRRVSSFTLLLAGVTINGIVMSVIMLLHNLASVRQSFAIVHWLMGNLDPIPKPTLAALAALILPVSFWLCLRARHWNLIAVGEDWAATRGASPARLLLEGYVAGSLITAALTAITGPIGFVGLVVPHALRLKLGGDHRLLMPASFFIGGAFLVICDTVARTLLPVELPVSVITALAGGPFFIALLRSRRKTLWL